MKKQKVMGGGETDPKEEGIKSTRKMTYGKRRKHTITMGAKDDVGGNYTP